jgi:hypothetical protein
LSDWLRSCAASSEVTDWAPDAIGVGGFPLNLFRGHLRQWTHSLTQRAIDELLKSSLQRLANAVPLRRGQISRRLRVMNFGTGTSIAGWPSEPATYEDVALAAARADVSQLLTS